MHNGVLLNKKRKTAIDDVFKNITKLELAIAEQKLDRCAVKHTGAWTPNKPTENQAIRELTEVRKVVVLADNGKSIVVDYPERWLKMFEKLCSIYANTPVIDVVKQRYVEQQERTGIERGVYYKYLEKFLSDSFILAVQYRTMKVS